MSRQRELDLLRLVCFFQVAALHVNSSVWSGLPLGSPQWLMATLLRDTWAVPVFVMLSGRFWLDPARAVTGAQLGKKALRLLAALLCWGLVYQLYYMSRDFENFTWKRFAAGVLTGAYHMWFLWMLLGLYAVTPLLRRISPDRQLTAWFLLLHFAVQTADYLFVPLAGKPLAQVLETAGLQTVQGYAGYFLLGYFLHSLSMTKKQARLLYAAGIGSWILSVSGNLLISWKTGNMSEFFSNYHSPLLMIRAAAVFVFFEKELARIRWKPWMEKLLAFTAKHGFGAYLVHALVNEYAVILVGKARLGQQPLLWMPLTTLLVAAGSFFLGALLRKLPKIGRWVC